MEIETFELVERDEDGTLECCEEQKAMIEKLGLEGQQSLLSGDDNSGPVNPYPQATAEQVAVYKSVFPKEISVETYDRGPMPLRVLQVLEHARTIFPDNCKFQVWCPISPLDLDPVLVARINHSTYHLLARWGEALTPYSDLFKKAVEKVRENFRLKAERIKRQTEIYLETIDKIPVEQLIEGSEPVAYHMDD